jgi:3-methyladenine DNA glycosylase/8-oxoguanine DNA glycosylase
MSPQSSLKYETIRIQLTRVSCTGICTAEMLLIFFDGWNDVLPVTKLGSGYTHKSMYEIASPESSKDISDDLLIHSLT